MMRLDLALPVRLRLALWSAALVTATLAVAAYISNATMRDALLRDVDATLMERAAQIEARIVVSPDQPLSEPPMPWQMATDAIEEYSAPGIYVQVYDASGKLLATSSNVPIGGLPKDEWAVELALLSQPDLTILPGGRARLRVLTRPLVAEGQTVGAIRVAASLHLLDTFLQRFEQLLLLVGVGGVILSLIGGWVLASRALAPVYAMTRIARRIAVDDQAAPEAMVLTEPPQGDEIGLLARTFNEMLTRLGDVFRRQREFIADTSHELRTPLTVIRTSLDLLELDLPAEDRRASLREAREEVDRMSRLIADLLFLTEADDRDAIVHGRVDLAEVARAVVRRARGPEGLTIRPGLLDWAVVLGDRDRLRQLLSNLVENAIRYTAPPGDVIVTVRRLSDRAVVSVVDTGIGITPEHHARIFERFYRVDRARARSLGGSGLGLAIVRRIAEAHGGTVRVESTPGRGSEFIVELPLAPIAAIDAESAQMPAAV
ncbi:MAG: HAMP domain-containing protein [Chloroflexota bacterium]|nr:MAG: HAMP domain-containing protein [Chloroflexota bacterium]